MDKTNTEVSVFTGQIFEITHKQVQVGDKIKTFEFAKRSPGTRLIIHNVKENKILLIQEFRYEHNLEDYRLPGGRVFETIEDYKTGLTTGIDITKIARSGAEREAAEETGFTVRNLELITVSHTGSTVIWDLYYFYCKDFTKPEENTLKIEENITVGWYSPDEIVTIIKEGKMNEDRSVGILMKFLLEKSLMKISMN